MLLDGTLWRKNLATGVEDTARLAEVPTRSFVVRADGTVVFAIGKDLRAWRADGSVQTHATLPKDIFALGWTGTARALAFTRIGEAFVFDLDRVNTFTDLKETVDKVSMSADPGLIVEAKAGSIHVLDPLAEHRRWTLARGDNISYLEPEISTDGRYVLARTPATLASPGALLLWTLGLPETQAETLTWRARMTNAVSEGGPKSLEWK